MKNRSHRYDINRTRPRHSYEYTNYKVWLRGIMVMWISNTKATSKAEFMKKLNNIDAELKKSVADIQKACITINKNSAVCLKPHNLPSVSKLITF